MENTVEMDDLGAAPVLENLQFGGSPIFWNNYGSARIWELQFWPIPWVCLYGMSEQT